MCPKAHRSIGKQVDAVRGCGNRRVHNLPMLFDLSTDITESLDILHSSRDRRPHSKRHSEASEIDDERMRRRTVLELQRLETNTLKQERSKCLHPGATPPNGAL